jgi:3-hydroxybutyryl-CoA dehydrogenase
MKADDIRKVGCLGGGVMGGGIGQTFAQAGYQVVIRELDEDLCAKTRAVLEDGRYGIKAAVTRGKLTQEQADKAMAAVSYVTDAGALAGCDMIIEAIPERLDLKQSEWAKMDKIVKPGALFASNTSGFVIQEVFRDVSRKDLSIGMHWFSPAPVMKVVEVIYAPETSEETTETLMETCRRIGKVPARIKDAPGKYGFAGNRIYFAMVEEARKVFEEGLATEEDIDTVMKLGYGWPAGPFSMVRGAQSGWQ